MSDNDEDKCVFGSLCIPNGTPIFYIYIPHVLRKPIPPLIGVVWSPIIKWSHYPLLLREKKNVKLNLIIVLCFDWVEFYLQNSFLQIVYELSLSRKSYLVTWGHCFCLHCGRSKFDRKQLSTFPLNLFISQSIQQSRHSSAITYAAVCSFTAPVNGMYFIIAYLAGRKNTILKKQYFFAAYLPKWKLCAFLRLITVRFSRNSSAIEMVYVLEEVTRILYEPP